MNGKQVGTVLASAVVVAAIIAGLVISGSPQQQRLLRLDDQRVGDLVSLSNYLSRYYRDNRTLPEELQALVDGRMLSALPRDPVSGQEYGYEILDRGEFRLCAEFALPSDGLEFDEFWVHAEGRQCFPFDYSSMRFQ